MFRDLSFFNSDVSKWDVSNVRTMRLMVHGATAFNSDVSKWVVSKVTDMKSLFSSSAFNGDVSKWDTSNVVNLQSCKLDCVLEFDLNDNANSA